MKKISRRNFFKIAGTGAAVASMNACASSTTDAVSGEPQVLAADSELTTKFTIGTVIAEEPSLSASKSFADTAAKFPNMDISFLNWTTTEAKTMAYQTGNYPELLIGTYVVETGDIVPYSEEGILLPLNDYISAELTPNIQRMFDEVEYYGPDMTQLDGNIYHLSRYGVLTPGRPVEDMLWINQEWLAQVGKEIPTTLDEFYEVLKAFKEAGDLNGNGENDEIPLLMRTALSGDNKTSFNSLCGMFGVADSNHSLTIVDDAVTYVRTTEAFKNTMIYMNKLYAEGLVDQEMFTMTNDMRQAKELSDIPVVGAMFTWTGRTANSVLGREVYVAVPPMRASDDIEPKWQARSLKETGVCAIAITDKAVKNGNVEEILRFVDEFLCPENSLQMALGEVGVHIEQVADKQYKPLLKEDGTSYLSTDRIYISGGDASRSAYLLPPSFYELYEWDEEDPEISEVAKEAIAVAIPLYAPYADQYMVTNINVPLTAEEAEMLVDAKADVKAYSVQMAAKFVTAGGIEEGWDAYVAEMNQLGVDKILEVYQPAYERAKELGKWDNLA